MKDAQETTATNQTEPTTQPKSAKAPTPEKPASDSRPEFMDFFFGAAFGKAADDLCRKDMNQFYIDAMLSSINTCAEWVKCADAVVGESFEAGMAMVRGETVDADRLLDTMKSARKQLTEAVTPDGDTTPVEPLNRMVQGNAEFMEKNIGEPLWRHAMALGSMSNRFIRALNEDARHCYCDMLAGKWRFDGDPFVETAEAGRALFSAMTRFPAMRA